MGVGAQFTVGSLVSIGSSISKVVYKFLVQLIIFYLKDGMFGFYSTKLVLLAAERLRSTSSSINVGTERTGSARTMNVIHSLRPPRIGWKFSSEGGCRYCVVI